MSAYFVASYNITDQSAYQKYLEAVVPTIIKYNGEVLMADYHVEALEGAPCQANIVLKFKDKATAQNWYQDPGYEAIKHLRLENTSDGIAFIGAQFVPPGA